MAKIVSEPHHANVPASIEFRVFTKCPYCGFENLHLLRRDCYPQVVVCDDTENGRCGRPYAVEFDVMIQPTTYEVK